MRAMISGTLMAVAITGSTLLGAGSVATTTAAGPDHGYWQCAEQWDEHHQHKETVCWMDHGTR